MEEKDLTKGAQKKTNPSKLLEGEEDGKENLSHGLTNCLVSCQLIYRCGKILAFNS